ncbi:PREDICTED: uncharacterized protein LOC104814140 [Tarenaya hassleriana]|uniref:uncharacterized protein LOC104814140 n=1 Tax=Tarenaya hassleriana TaxID=28532 RepID=UPI00053C4D5C|nr:PREDICTED: uncharacterized protein LOC104814140 [Tarenaya hassleriana]
MEKLKIYAVMCMMMVVISSTVTAEEIPVTADQMNLAAEAAAESFKNSVGDVAQGTKTWVDWAAQKMREMGGGVKESEQ